MDDIELTTLRNTIEELDKIHHEQIFKIIKKHKVIFSENNNGIFVNLSELTPEILLELKLYLKYIQRQENEINEMEEEKNKFKKILNTEPIHY